MVSSFDSDTPPTQPLRCLFALLAESQNGDMIDIYFAVWFEIDYRCQVSAYVGTPSALRREENSKNLFASLNIESGYC